MKRRRERGRDRDRSRGRERLGMRTLEILKVQDFETPDLQNPISADDAGSEIWDPPEIDPDDSDETGEFTHLEWPASLDQIYRRAEDLNTAIEAELLFNFPALIKASQSTLGRLGAMLRGTLSLDSPVLIDFLKALEKEAPDWWGTFGTRLEACIYARYKLMDLAVSAAPNPVTLLVHWSGDAWIVERTLSERETDVPLDGQPVADIKDNDLTRGIEEGLSALLDELCGMLGLLSMGQSSQKQELADRLGWKHQYVDQYLSIITVSIEGGAPVPILDSPLIRRYCKSEDRFREVWDCLTGWQREGKAMCLQEAITELGKMTGLKKARLYAILKKIREEDLSLYSQVIYAVGRKQEKN